MRIVRALVLASAAIALGCHSKANVTIDVDAASTAPAESSACAAIRQLRATSDAGAPAKKIGECVPTTGGAWGVLVTDPEPTLNGAPPDRILFRVAHAAGPNVVLGETMSLHDIAKVTTFDFDGDGEAELVLEGPDPFCRSSSDTQCLDRRPAAFVVGLAKGAVAEYAPLADLAPPKGLEQAGLFLASPGKIERDTQLRTSFLRAVDVDHDGRPDFETKLRYAVDATDGDVSRWVLEGPTFVAHSLPNGTFSADDPVALGALASACDAAAPFPKAAGKNLVEAAVCARLEGASVALIRKSYGDRCEALRRGNAKKPPDDSFDPDAIAACRVETEGGWNDARGMPTSLGQMLVDTSPLLQSVKKGAAAKP